MASQARRLVVAVVLAILVGALYTSAVQADAEPGVTSRISVSSAGTQANLESCCPAVSASGRFIAFASSASNLLANDTNGKRDVFVRDRETMSTELISKSNSAQMGNGDSYQPAISADGRFVAFVSESGNLVSGDTNGQKDVFVRDRQAGVTERISVGNDGSQAVAWSDAPAISADGRFVVFISAAFNLVTGDTNWQNDVFIRDREAATTRRLSVSSGGSQANGGSDSPVVSSDGRLVAFVSQANNLVVGDTNAQSDVFLHNRQTGVTERVSVDSSGGQANGASYNVAISTDGRFVAFGSGASNLVTGDSNRQSDVFVRDRQTGVTRRVSVDSGGAQSDGWSDHPEISGDGHYVVYSSLATNLVPSDTNGASDIFVYDQSGTRRVSVSGSGTQGNAASNSPAISQDGRVMVFASLASNLVANDVNGVRDVFAQDPQGAVPTVEAGPGATVDEGGVFAGSGHFIDPDQDVWSATVDYGDGSGTELLDLSGKTFSLRHRYLDDGVYTITVKVADDDGVGSDTATVTVRNVAPIVGPIETSAQVIPVGTTVTVVGTFSDPGVADVHSAVLDWGDGSGDRGSVAETGGSGSASGSHSYIAAGIYPIRLTIADDDGASAATTYRYVVVFDSKGPSVTGGGWFESAAGALPARPEAAGRVSLSLVADYRGQPAVPRGTLELNIPGGDIRLHSDTLEWLVVTPDVVELKGSGTINGAGDYGFVLAVTVGERRANKVWITIYDKQSNAVLYSNNPSSDMLAVPVAELAGGRIITHRK